MDKLTVTFAIHGTPVDLTVLWDAPTDAITLPGEIRVLDILNGSERVPLWLYRALTNGSWLVDHIASTRE